jgi:hypothetical protein
MTLRPFLRMAIDDLLDEFPLEKSCSKGATDEQFQRSGAVQQNECQIHDSQPQVCLIRLDRLDSGREA